MFEGPLVPVHVILFGKVVVPPSLPPLPPLLPSLHPPLPLSFPPMRVGGREGEEGGGGREGEEGGRRRERGRDGCVYRDCMYVSYSQFQSMSVCIL